MLREDLKAAVIAILLERPGHTAGEVVADILTFKGRIVSRRDVNSVLYLERGDFRHGGETPPRWYAHEDASVLADVELLYRLRMQRLDQLVERVESILAQATAIDEPASDLDDATRWLRRWQREALDAWTARGGRGIVEAVTGTGKTRVAVEAIDRARQLGLRSLVLVPSVVLQEQWVHVLADALDLTDVSLVGGSGGVATGVACPVTVAVINSASRRWTELDGQFDLLIGDECHRYGAPTFRQALLPSARLRLGLTATLERNDDGVEDTLVPYFGEVCYRYDFSRARREGVIAPYRVMTIGVNLDSDSQYRYGDAGKRMGKARKRLVAEHGCPERPIGEFMKMVGRLAGGWGEASALAGAYLGALKERRQILSESPEKQEVLASLVPAIRASGHAVTFTETIEAAETIDTLLSTQGVMSSPYHSGKDSDACREALEAFEAGDLECLVAVRALDEGVDVPSINLGIVAAATQQRRQMIQRMGRVVRRKDDGRGAAFVVIYARGTSEDPAQAADEIESSHYDDLLANAEAIESLHASDVDRTKMAATIAAWVASPNSRACTP